MAALWAGIGALVLAPAWSLIDPPRRRFWVVPAKLFWLLPAATGLLPVVLGCAGIIHVLVTREVRGYLPAAAGIVLGVAASWVALTFCLAGAVGRELML